MKTLLAILALSIIPATVQADTTVDVYSAAMEPASKAFRRVDVGSGRTNVDVELFDTSLNPPPNMKLSCRFFDPYGTLKSVQNNVEACRVFTNLSLPSHLNAEITNDNPCAATYQVKVVSR